MLPLEALRAQREAIRESARRYRTVNPGVFGSTPHGTDTEGSDLDLLVDTLPGTTLFDLGGLQDELEALLKIPVDIKTPLDLPAKFREKVLTEARSV